MAEQVGDDPAGSHVPRPEQRYRGPDPAGDEQRVQVRLGIESGIDLVLDDEVTDADRDLVSPPGRGDRDRDRRRPADASSGPSPRPRRTAPATPGGRRSRSPRCGARGARARRRRSRAPMTASASDSVNACSARRSAYRSCSMRQRSPSTVSSSNPGSRPVLASRSAANAAAGASTTVVSTPTSASSSTSRAPWPRSSCAGPPLSSRLRMLTTTRRRARRSRPRRGRGSVRDHAHRHPAVDEELGAGHVGGLVGQQEEHHGRDVVAGTEPSHRHRPAPAGAGRRHRRRSARTCRSRSARARPRWHGCRAAPTRAPSAGSGARRPALVAP